MDIVLLRPEIVLSPGARDDARVHEGRHGEVDEDEEGDDPLEDWHGVPLLDQNVPFDTPVVMK